MYSEHELALVKKGTIPRHVAFIMDGNRRWEKKHRSRSEEPTFSRGHWAGADALTTLVDAAEQLGIQVVTVYAFSTENWDRSALEVASLLSILASYLKKERPRMVERGVRLHTIGELSSFSSDLQELIEQTCRATAEGKKLDLVMGLNYGGRDELRRAFIKLSEQEKKGLISMSSLSEKEIAAVLDTAPFGDPDLLIRTSGEQRVSNFLLWQLAYTEIYCTEVLWPDFAPRDLLTAVLDFQKRQRRVGK